VLASHSSIVHILLGRGDATFVQQTLTLIPQSNIGMDNTDVDVADVNGDTIDDVVVALALNGTELLLQRTLEERACVRVIALEQPFERFALRVSRRVLTCEVDECGDAGAAG
jgi:hypothetical protein